MIEQQAFSQMHLHSLYSYRTHDLATELNFHLTEYQTGRLGKPDEVAEPSRQVGANLVSFDLMAYRLWLGAR